MSRRAASFTQADVARIIRAAKQAGAVMVEVRLSDQATVVVHLTDATVPADKPERDIIL